eukprot:COSAG06_NODE_1803_length_8361_cov_28.682401_5_plen_127_part_00
MPYCTLFPLFKHSKRNDSFYQDRLGTKVRRKHKNVPAGPFCSGAEATLTSPELWSPQNPTQYTAVIELIDSGGAVLDSVSVKFGVRKLETIGAHKQKTFVALSFVQVSSHSTLACLICWSPLFEPF